MLMQKKGIPFYWERATLLDLNVKWWAHLTKRRIIEKTCFIFLAGSPLNEPICRHGSIVLNTADEMALAHKEYQQNKFLKPNRQSYEKSIERDSPLFGVSTGVYF